LKVEGVKQKIDDCSQPIHQLKRDVSILKTEASSADELEALERNLQTVEKALKTARNYGEDLVDDMLALDSLSHLFPDDRQTRKASLAQMDTLMDEVDQAKTKLASVQKELKQKIQDIKLKSQAETQTADVDNKKPIVPETLDDIPAAPSQSAWEEVHLPLLFHAYEGINSFNINATISGVAADSVKIKLLENGELEVSGLKIPTQADTRRMRQTIFTRLVQLAQMSPQRFEQFGGAQGVNDKTYIELGQGKFGRFSRAFKLPANVEVDKVEASYRDGQIRIEIPTSGWDVGRFGLGSSNRAPRMPLFGSFHDDFFRR